MSAMGESRSREVLEKWFFSRCGAGSVVLCGLGLGSVLCRCVRKRTSARACPYKCTQVSPDCDLVRELVDGRDLYSGEA